MQKLEFVRAVSGGIRYVIVTLSPNCLARFFHRCACHVPSIESMRLTSNSVPPLPDVMPHTEPPEAYAHIDPLRIKFLERQELRSQRWVSSNISPTIQSIGSQSAYGSSPDTLLSSNASVCSSQGTLGSPSLLPALSYTMIKEKFHPTYTLRNPEGIDLICRQLVCYFADPITSRL